ncbi:hypothetical protein HYC85_009515 [Camellia sinensis]|uniref:Reverse transcriptase Ty1/copia-type domain-containing protein n=1 Tax=Camellia sinensis TaxID=4442 RepID=A0A7J7HH36_CAMSI|nr:hypothetical protein HYC85_009515 [Camellia sinensis]
MEIKRDRKKGTVCLTQTQYLKKVLDRFGINGKTKAVSTPLAPHFKLSASLSPHTEEERKHMAQVPYANAVGALMYAMVCTRPDISHAVSMVSRYMHDPGKDHWQAVKWILRYIHGTVNLGLKFERDNRLGQNLEGYVDSDYAGDLDKRRSTTGYLFTLAKGPVSWRSTLQSTVALSITEAEYMAVTEAFKEAIWLHGLIEDLGIVQKHVKVFCDSQSAICLAKNQVHHARTKHIDVRFHFIREIVNEGDILLQKIGTADNPADMLTKVVSGIKLSSLEDLHDCVGDLLPLPHIEHALAQEHDETWVDEVVDGYLRLLDVCSTAKDIFSRTKQAVQDLLSMLRRRRDAHDFQGYLASRKMVKKAIKKSLKDLKSIKNKNTYLPKDKDSKTVAIFSMLTEVEAATLAVFESLLSYVGGTKVQLRQKSWSLVSKLMQHKSAESQDEANGNEFEKLDGALKAGKFDSIQNQLGKMELEYNLSRPHEGFKLFDDAKAVKIPIVSMGQVNPLKYICCYHLKVIDLALAKAAKPYNMKSTIILNHQFFLRYATDFKEKKIGLVVGKPGGGGTLRKHRQHII